MELIVNNIKITLTQDQIDQIVKESTKTKSIEWTDFGLAFGYFVNENGKIAVACNAKHYYSKNVFPSTEEAEACLALSQLCQWRDKRNEGWRPNWKDSTYKYIITFASNNVLTEKYLSTHHILCFKTFEIRDKFLEDFHSLIETAKPLL